MSHVDLSYVHQSTRRLKLSVPYIALYWYYSVHRNIETPWSISWWAMHQTHCICVVDVTGSDDGWTSRKRQIRGPTTKIIAVIRSRVLYRVSYDDVYRGHRTCTAAVDQIIIIWFTLFAIGFPRYLPSVGKRWWPPPTVFFHLYDAPSDDSINWVTTWKY